MSLKAKLESTTIKCSSNTIKQFIPHGTLEKPDIFSDAIVKSELMRHLKRTPGHSTDEVLSTSTTVIRIRLHPSHNRLLHEYSESEHMNTFALKQIPAFDLTRFNQEAGALRCIAPDFGYAHIGLPRKPGDKELQMGARTYRSPEADTPHSDISSAADIWSLGCMFLEFATWQLLGWDAVEEDFPQARLEAEPDGGVIVDAFFIRHRDGRIEVKPAVRRWVDDLMGRAGYSPFLEELLRLVVINMLCVDAAERDSAEDVSAKLKVMSDRCQIEQNLCQSQHS
ncbi:hypothetical protein HYQ46_006292 [Verticillium longisporum]|nr:hypothetical protein HYQ46_006292 [Verticillium longisporum]